jgi:soluble lytic murein transglycosylase-like protein
VHRRLILTILAFVIVAVAAPATLAPSASAYHVPDGQLKAQLRQAKQQLSAARDRAKKANADLAAALELRAQLGGDPGVTPPAAIAPPPGMDAALAGLLLADGVVSDGEIVALKTRVAQARKLVLYRADKARRLAKRVQRRAQIATWARRHNWRPLIEIAGRKYGVSPAGLYRMMILESSGQPTVVSGPYKGLFQFTTSAWARHWNPWRHESIFNGWAQIRACALALSKGMGPGQWPNTYPMAF